jgi:hypothetical protein
MRRVAVILGTTVGLLAVSAPAYAYAHDRVHNPYLHAALDLLTLAVVTAPVWTAFQWARGKRSLWLIGLIAGIQVPAGVLAFVPIKDPILHTLALVTSLAVTVTSIVYVRREAAQSKAAVAHTTTG